MTAFVLFLPVTYSISDFKLVEFDQFKHEAGANYFVLSPQRWIETTNAVGLLSKSGRYGGTFALGSAAIKQLQESK